MSCVRSRESDKARLRASRRKAALLSGLTQAEIRAEARTFAKPTGREALSYGSQN